MNNKNWREYAELIGIAAIVASLVFVGLQLKQSQDIAIAAQYAERSSEARESWENGRDYTIGMINMATEHREHLKDATGVSDEISDEDLGILYAGTRAYMAILDNNLYQYQSGFMTDESWAVYDARIRRNCRAGLMVNIILSNHPEVFRSSFVELCLGSGTNRN